MIVLEKLNAGLARVVVQGKRQLWSTGKIRGRAKTCVECDQTFPSGTIMWREVTACAMNRMDRVCAPCFDRLLAREKTAREYRRGMGIDGDA